MQVFSCETCEIFKNTFSYWTLLVAASILNYMNVLITVILNRKINSFQNLPVSFIPVTTVNILVIP